VCVCVCHKTSLSSCFVPKEFFLCEKNKKFGEDSCVRKKWYLSRKTRKKARKQKKIPARA